MNVLFSIDTLTTGGAETFVLRLSEALIRRGNIVQIFVLRGDLINWDLVHGIAPSVHVIPFRLQLFNLIQKIDGLLFKMGIDFSFVRWMQIQKMKKVLIESNIDIVHSNLVTSDIVTLRACKSFNIPWITTIHGDYFGNYEKKKNPAARIQSFDKILTEIENNISHIVCITDQQKLLLEKIIHSQEVRQRISKIYNGYEELSSSSHARVVPEILSHIPKENFVIGMVARGIVEKGWDILVSVFIKMNIKDTWLVLVGDGEYIQQLKTEIKHPRIIFTGNVIDPLNYIAKFDVGCLPSRYSSESLPTSVIEYLYMNKPVVATRVGEIATMIDTNTQNPSGILIESTAIDRMTDEMIEALTSLYKDKSLYKSFKDNTSRSFLKFNMSECVENYLEIYKKANV